MHVTNGIVIQVQTATATNVRHTARVLTERKRSFQPMEDAVARYQGKTREEPGHLHGIRESTMGSESLIEASQFMDLFVGSFTCTSDVVPSWKGFN